MIDRHDPSVVVYDVGPPYEESWNMFERRHAGRRASDGDPNRSHAA